MLPFVTTFDTVREGKHRFVCKLHTKRSSYLRGGDAWRDELVTILSPAAREALRSIETCPRSVLSRARDRWLRLRMNSSVARR